MAQYRKKPVVIEAVQLRWDNWSEMCEFADVGALADGKPTGCYVDADGNATAEATETLGLHIPTLEGLMLARQDDWVIRGVKGELYPCNQCLAPWTTDKRNQRWTRSKRAPSNSARIHRRNRRLARSSGAAPNAARSSRLPEGA